MLWTLRGALRSLRRLDHRSALGYVAGAVSERYFEWKYGVRTAPTRGGGAAGSGDCHEYEATEYRRLHRVFRSLHLGRDAEMLDIGAGMGRALVVASTYPFRSVVGVEYSEDLSAIARENLRRMRAVRRCRRVDVVTADARDYDVPTTTTVVFMFNPFHGAVLETVLSNLGRSLATRPRRLTLVLTGPVHFERSRVGAALFRKVSEFRMPPAVARTSVYVSR